MLEIDDAPEDEEVDDVLGVVGDKKKKKKRTAKKKAKSPGLVPCKPQHIRNLTGFTDYYVSHGQTELLTKPVSDLFPSGTFPVGEILPHGKTKYPNPSSSYSRTSAEERRY